jgi:hypothetical protein
MMLGREVEREGSHIVIIVEEGGEGGETLTSSLSRRAGENAGERVGREEIDNDDDCGRGDNDDNDCGRGGRIFIVIASSHCHCHHWFRAEEMLGI